MSKEDSGKSLRETLEESYDSAEGEDETGASDTETESSSASATETEADASSAKDEAGESDESSAETGESDAGTGEVSAEKAEAETEEGEKDAGESSGDDDPVNSAPAGWKAAAREDWDKVPASVRAEVHRREQNIRDVLQDSADKRTLAEEFQRVIHPFEPLVASQGSTPMAAVKSFFETAAGLSLGSAPQKAQIIANIIQQYGVDIGELDTVLSGQVTSGNSENTEITRLLDDKLKPIQDFMGSFQDAGRKAEAANAENLKKELDTFAKTHEFYDDVRENMADLLDLAANRGETLTLEQAYEKALKLDDEIQRIIQARVAAANAGANNSEVDRKIETASTSITDDGAAAKQEQAPTTLRGQLEHSWNQHSG